MSCAGTAQVPLGELASAPGSAWRVLRKASSVEVPGGYLSRPEPIEYPTTNSATSHMIYYPPANQVLQRLRTLAHSMHPPGLLRTPRLDWSGWVEPAGSHSVLRSGAQPMLDMFRIHASLSSRCACTSQMQRHCWPLHLTCGACLPAGL